MSTWTRSTSSWRQGVVVGTLFGTLQFLSHLRHSSVLNGLVVGALEGVFFGAVMGGFLARRRRREVSVLDALPEDQRRTVLKATHRGPLPDQPELRNQTLRMARHQLGEIDRQRTFSLLTFASFLALSIWLAAEVSAWWLVAVPFWLVLLGLAEHTRHQLRTRSERLSTST